MQQHFLINKGSVLPVLRLGIVNDCRINYNKLYLALLAADATFSMVDVNTGIKKIANAPAKVVEVENDSCDTQCILQYEWKPRDTKESGIYRGQFNIKFSDELSMDGVTFPSGNLLVPIAEELIITVNDGCIKV